MVTGISPLEYTKLYRERVIASLITSYCLLVIPASDVSTSIPDPLVISWWFAPRESTHFSDSFSLCVCPAAKLPYLDINNCFVNRVKFLPHISISRVALPLVQLTL